MPRLGTAPGIPSSPQSKLRNGYCAEPHDSPSLTQCYSLPTCQLRCTTGESHAWRTRRTDIDKHARGKDRHSAAVDWRTVGNKVRFSRTSLPANDLHEPPQPHLVTSHDTRRGASQSIPNGPPPPIASLRSRPRPRQIRAIQSASPRTAAERKEMDPPLPPTAEGSPFRHQPTALCELWRRAVAHDVGSAPRSVLLLDALPPPPIHPLHPHRGKRAGGPGSCHPMNLRLPNEAFRNKRAAGGEGGSPEIRINLQVQATNRPGDLLGGSPRKERQATQRKDPPDAKQFTAPGPPDPEPRADGRPPAAFLF